MSEWREVTLNDIVSILGDGLHGTPKFDDKGDCFFINGNNLSNGKIIIKPDTRRTTSVEYEKYKKKLSERTILLSINGTLGNIAYYNNEKCILGKSACYMNVLDTVNKDYIRYILTDRQFQNYIDIFAHGSTIKNVSLKTIREYPFSLPPLPEQKVIARALSSLDDKIDLLHRQNKTLEAMAEALFRQWFVEKADEEWEEKPLKDVVNISIGRTPPRQEFHWFSKNPSDVKWISIKDLGTSGVFVFNTAENLTKEAVKSFNIPIIPKDTVILSFKMTVGRVGITTEEMLSNEAIAHFIFHEKTPFTKEYLYFYLKRFNYDSLGTTSSIVTAINSSMIKDIIIKTPSKSNMANFKEIVEKQFEKIKMNQIQIRTLENFRDTLLPKLMSGEVRVVL
jgi:type I restriction enzyme S subunit